MQDRRVMGGVAMSEVKVVRELLDVGLAATQGVQKGDPLRTARAAISSPIASITASESRVGPSASLIDLFPIDPLTHGCRRHGPIPADPEKSCRIGPPRSTGDRWRAIGRAESLTQGYSNA